MEQRGIPQVAHMDSSRRKVALTLCGLCLENHVRFDFYRTHGIRLVVITTAIAPSHSSHCNSKAT